MKFEVGKYYKRRDGQKALCVYVWPNGTAAFVLADRPMWSWSVGVSGSADSRVVCDSDITGEWKELREWTVYVVECNNSGGPWATLDPQGHHTILARHELTEGNGL